MLRRTGHLEHIRFASCPGSGVTRADTAQMPTLDDELLMTEAPEQVIGLWCIIAGDYGYSLGYVENGRYRGTRNLHRPYFAILADAPSFDLPDYRSLNHGGRGQNVLFENCRVIFLRMPHPAGHPDHFYVNDTGVVAAGRHRDDSVIAAGTSIMIGRSFELFRFSADYQPRSLGRP
jgi:hypothetical protein